MSEAVLVTDFYTFSYLADEKWDIMTSVLRSMTLGGFLHYLDRSQGTRYPGPGVKTKLKWRDPGRSVC